MKGCLSAIVLIAAASVPAAALAPAPEVDRYDKFMCDSDMECEEATGYPYDTAMGENPPKYPRLVGIGCEGAHGPIYAFEEDHFPRCREIFEMDWDWMDED